MKDFKELVASLRQQEDRFQFGRNKLFGQAADAIVNLQQQVIILTDVIELNRRNDHVKKTGSQENEPFFGPKSS